jgi:hypothetical protein
MSRMRVLLVLAAILAVSSLVACSGGGPEAPSDARTQATGADIPHASVLEYVSSRDPAFAPSGDLDWSGEIIDTGDLVGATHYRYTADAWKMVIVVPVVAPEMTVYQIQLTNEESGFSWEGTVDRDGKVVDDAPPPQTARVQGWMGRVLALPDGDDFVEFSPEGSGAIGIAGATESVEAQIVDMRDRTGAGEYANFWGSVECSVDDYQSCRLVVDHLRAGTEQTGPEAVDGWVGQIVSQADGAQFDDAFVLSGDFPIWFGIASAIGGDGWPTYDQALADLRDSGKDITVWGQMLCGVPDSNGCQIQANRIERDGQMVDPHPDWETYSNGIFGFSFRYPADWTLEEIPAGLNPATESMPASGPAVRLTKDSSLVYIGFRRPTQDFFLGGTGMPSGDFEDRGEVPFLGTTLKKQAIVLEGKDKVLLYGPYEGASLVVLIRVDDQGQADYQQVDIPMETEFAVDRILGTFELPPP